VQLALQLVRQTFGYSPPVAARAFGYIGVTLYEAVVPGMPDYQSLAGQLNGLTRTNLRRIPEIPMGERRPGDHHAPPLPDRDTGKFAGN